MQTGPELVWCLKAYVRFCVSADASPVLLQDQKIGPMAVLQKTSLLTSPDMITDTAQE